MIARRWYRAVALLALASCAEREPTPAVTRREEPAPPAAPSRPAPPATPPRTPTPSPSPPPAAPSTGCAMGTPIEIAQGGWASVAALGDGFVVAGSTPEGERESVFVTRVAADGTSTVLASAPLAHPVPGDHRRAAPAVAASGSRVAVAITDGERRLQLAEIDASAPRALSFVPAGESASLRFAPALAASGDGWAVAWTEERERSLSARAARFAGGEVRPLGELRSGAGGSAAPVFVRGASGAELVFLDPRAGVSVAHRASVDGATLAAPRVARPLNLVTEPPEIAAVRVGDREWLAYTAVGSAATTAIGLLPLEGSAPPVPLVPGTGYGVLHVDAASLGPDRAVLVADAPLSAPPTAPREVQVRVLGPDGAPGEPASVRGPNDRASRGRVAAAADGSLAVTFTDGDRVYVSLGRCAAR